MSETQKFKPYKEVIDKQPPVRLTERGKNVIKGGAAVLAAAGLIAGAAAKQDRENPYETLVKEGKTTEYVVQPGDTAWEIAKSIDGSDKDNTDLINELHRQSWEDGDGMQPGEPLHIPIDAIKTEENIVVRKASGIDQ